MRNADEIKARCVCKLPQKTLFSQSTAALQIKRDDNPMALTVLNSLIEAFPSRVTGAKQVSSCLHLCLPCAIHSLPNCKSRDI